MRFGVFIYFPQFEPPYRLSLRPSTVRHKAAEKDLARIAALRSRRTLVSDTVQGLACEVVTAFGMSIASAEKIPESAVLELDTYKVNDAVQ